MEEPKKPGCSSSLVVSLLIITFPLVYFAFFQIDQLKAHFANWPDIKPGSGNLQKDANNVKDPFQRLMRGEQREQLKKTGFVFLSEKHSDSYVSRKEVRFDTNSSTVYIHSNQQLKKYRFQPYPLKDYKAKILNLVKPIEIQHGDMNPPACNFIHDDPAVIFSSGGFVGNIYHEINDVIIPLFITSRHFRSRVKFVVTDYHFWFIYKFRNVIDNLSNFEVIDASEATNGKVHCFPGAVVGLKSHGFLSLNKSDNPGGHSMSEFRDFLTSSYNFKIRDVSALIMGSNKPNLLLLSRKGTETRTILNQDEVVKMMEELGFRVIVSTMKMMRNMYDFVHIVRSCSVMVGVHGAGLTNELFLPDGAVTIQVVPLGLEWAAEYFYGEPAKGMGLHYLEYKIEPQESSLLDLYGPDHPVITDPKSIEDQGYKNFRAIYMDKQNVKINVERFRKTLVEAMSLLGQLN
ncbi:OLC1v1022685C1 [Oldenlandia corymbosa var. corymbosa]|uniref:OLC1v1022685C1 n=1 Tax=Oldenlandia corymbosa var. corymbosa TaxID=529605 RepID=A0AAV1BYF6_OLDCO|nr:OLC1v1022685C1 [Oldenlandia corymbosa var. corymbosa]